jgi:hypothetical protein
MAGMTLSEYVNAYYGGTLGISKRYGIKKADDPLTTADTTYFNTMYGAAVFNQLNTKSEIFKLLRKEGWTQSGWRVLTARGTTTSGAPESGTFGDTGNDVEGDVPDLVEVAATVKEVVTPWDVSTRAEMLSEADDGVKGLAAFLRREQAEAHSYYIDAMLMQDGDTLAGDNFESLDRVCTNDAAAQLSGWDADDDDIYNIDRDTGSWHHATVSYDNSADRALTLAMLDSLIQGAMENGVNYDDLIFLTGHDTLQDIKQLLQATSNSTWRFDLGPMGQGSKNGVSAERGMNLDARVGYYDSIPIFVSQHVPQDTISRVYLLDMAHLKMRMAAPTTYVSNEDLGVLQKLAKEHAFITAGELIATKFNTQGQIRDLQ